MILQHNIMIIIICFIQYYNVMFYNIITVY